MTLNELKQEVTKKIKNMQSYELRASIEVNHNDQPEGEDGFIYQVNVNLIVDGKLQESYILESLQDEFVAKLRIKHVQDTISKW